MKKLLITCTELMMIQFLVPHVKYLSENGFQVEVALSHVGGRMEDCRKALEGIALIHQVRLERSPVSPRNFLGYGDMKKLLKENHYDIIWTNEPVMGVITRLAANKYRRKGTKVVYMCHGFHFFDGASKARWLIYYPIEKIMARLCDAIVTMNMEDYQRASSFPVKNVYKIPGVGVDTARFRMADPEAVRTRKRQELGLSEDKYVLLTVGELTKRKNQEVALRAMAALEDPSVEYVLCGKGDQREHLEALAQELGIRDRVHFLGYRLDVPEIYRAADCFVFPSVHEGLPFALMEAMESGLPIVCSRIRGNVDLIEEQRGGILCDVYDAGGFRAALEKIRTMDVPTLAEYNRKKLREFDLCVTKKRIHSILREMTEQRTSESVPTGN